MELETITFENGEFKDKDGTLINPEKIGVSEVIVVDVPSFKDVNEEQLEKYSKKRDKQIKDICESDLYQKANSILCGNPCPLEISSIIPHQNTAKYIALPIEFYKK